MRTSHREIVSCRAWSDSHSLLVTTSGSVDDEKRKVCHMLLCLAERTEPILGGALTTVLIIEAVRYIASTPNIAIFANIEYRSI